jgi:hypothetical protein
MPFGSPRSSTKGGYACTAVDAGTPAAAEAEGVRGKLHVGPRRFVVAGGAVRRC